MDNDTGCVPRAVYDAWNEEMKACLQEQAGDPDSLPDCRAAALAVAARHNLFLLVTDRADSVRVYQTQEGDPSSPCVNLWLEGNTGRLEEGGIGFDDQIDWAFPSPEESEDVLDQPDVIRFGEMGRQEQRP